MAGDVLKVLRVRRTIILLMGMVVAPALARILDLLLPRLPLFVEILVTTLHATVVNLQSQLVAIDGLKCSVSSKWCLTPSGALPFIGLFC